MASAVLQVLNVICSGYVIFFCLWNEKALTAFATNVFLTIYLFHQHIQAANAGLNDDVAISNYKFLPAYFNVIDPAVRFDPNWCKNDRACEYALQNGYLVKDHITDDDFSLINFNFCERNKAPEEMKIAVELGERK